jgi:hypothetical protein
MTQELQKPRSFWNAWRDAVDMIKRMIANVY